MRRPPPRVRFDLTPTEAFAVFVSSCTVGILGTIATLLLWPWSLPFAIVGAGAGGYAVARFVHGRIHSS